MKTPKWLLLSSLAASAMLLASTAGSAPIETSGAFELEGNAVDESVAGDDWNQIYCADPDTTQKDVYCVGVAPPSADHLLSQFITDKFNDSADDQFPGTNKDIDATLSLGPGNVNDKNDIEHAFAAIYKKDGVQYLFFGVDVLATNGDAAIGFWFTQNSKATVIGGPWTRKIGDILVQADLINGGTTARVDVYTWGPNSGLNQLIGGELYLFQRGAKCNLDPGNVYACAITNGGDVTAPWAYTFKDKGNVGPSEVFPKNAFFEGGLNLTAVFGGRLPCFSTVLAETRQSQSETSELADVAVGDFAVCSIKVKKESQDLSKVGDTVYYTITIENTGLGRVYKQSIVDSLLGDLGSYCGAYLDPGAKCTISYNRVVVAGDPDPLTNTVTAKYNEREDLLGAVVTAFYKRDVNLFQPKISLTKSGTPTLVAEYSNVEYKLEVKNLSSSDTPKLVGCTIKDGAIGVDEGPFELTTGGTKTVTKSYAWKGIKTDPNCVKVGTNYECTNKASASCGVDGFKNTLTADATFKVTVVPAEPVFRVVKTGDEYSKVGDVVAYKVTIFNDSPYFPLKITSVKDSLAGDLTAKVIAKCTDTLTITDGDDTKGTDQCTYDYTYLVPADPKPANPLLNTVTVIGEVIGGGTATREGKWSVKLLAPGVDIAKSCAPTTPVPPRSWVSFAIDTTNTGDADLVVNISDVLLAVDEKDVSLPKKPPSGTCVYGPVAGGDADTADGCYRIEKSYQVGTEDVTNTASVTAFLDKKYGTLTYGGLPNKYTDTASSTCTVLKGGATRTWGFWKTHGSDGDRFSDPYPRFGYTGYIAELMLPIDLGWIKLSSIEEVFGLFWERKAQCDKLTQTRLQASYQFLAAMMNSYAFGTDIPDVCTKGAAYKDKSNAELFAMMRAALLSGNEREIRSLASVFACYNEYGDEIAIDDIVPVPPADPNGTRGIAADVVTWCK